MKDSEYKNAMTIYKGTNKNNKTENFRLRMWISEDTNFSDGAMNDKKFTVTVNVYANAKIVTN